MLAALNTGHEGGCGTLHANSADDVPIRLEALGIAAGLRRDAVHAQAAAALDAVVHLTRDTTGLRRLASIDVLTRTTSGWLGAHPAFTVQSDGSVVPGAGRSAMAEMLAARGCPP
nr:ATPase, T2SS/T4P/T4SS family [Phytoactinopolyspora limicola]